MLTSHASMSSPILSYLILSYLILSYPILAPLQLMVGINRGVKYIVTAAWLLESVNKKKVSLHYFYDVNAAQLLLHNCSTAQHNTLQYSTVQYSTVQYIAVQFSTVQNRTSSHPIQSNHILLLQISAVRTTGHTHHGQVPLHSEGRIHGEEMEVQFV